VTRTSSIIEINGNRYDAMTGEMLGGVKKGAHQIKRTTSGVIDGFVKQPAASVSRSSSHHAQTASRRIKQTAQNVHKKTQRSKTLMRTGVKKPEHTPHTEPTRHHHATALHNHHSPSQRSHTPIKVPNVTKNSSVRRFGHLDPKHTPSHHKTVMRGEVISHPKHSQTKSSAAAVAKPLPSMVTSASHQQLERMLDHALAAADAHKRAPGRSKKLLKAPVIILGLVILALAVFVILWKNVPAVAMKVAAMRSHVDATTPGYAPTGFSYAAPVTYKDNAVTLNYQLAADKTKSFQIVQQKSDWDSTTLASNALQGKERVQTSEVNGTTVYVYGSANDAVWVNHGIRYTLKDNAGLNSEQILKIANSL
jgi:hypothetical protein